MEYIGSLIGSITFLFVAIATVFVLFDGRGIIRKLTAAAVAGAVEIFGG